MLEIKEPFGEWKEASREQAEAFYKTFCERATAIRWENRQKYFNKYCIRGGHVMTNGTVETAEEQTERVFAHYKNELAAKAGAGDGSVRFNVVEYVCGLPKIDPFVMAASLAKDGITISYDDSSISRKDNQAKKRRVEEVLQKDADTEMGEPDSVMEEEAEM